MSQVEGCYKHGLLPAPRSREETDMELTGEILRGFFSTTLMDPFSISVADRDRLAARIHEFYAAQRQLLAHEPGAEIRAARRDEPAPRPRDF